MDRPPLAPATNRPAVETLVVTEEAKPARSGSPLANTLLGFDGAAARPAAERVCCARAPRPPPDEEGAPRPPAAPTEREDDEDDDAALALLREQLKATERALARRKREEAAATPFLEAVFEDATFASPPTSPPGLVAPEAARPQVQAAAAARDRLEQTRKPRRQRLSAKKPRERPVRVVVVDDEPAGCLLPSCFEETMTDDLLEVEVARAPVGPPDSPPRRPAAVSRHWGDSFPRMMAVGGFFLDFGPMPGPSAVRGPRSP